MREVGILKKDPEQIKEQIRKLDMSSKSFSTPFNSVRFISVVTLGGIQSNFVFSPLLSYFWLASFSCVSQTRRMFIDLFNSSNVSEK